MKRSLFPGTASVLTVSVLTASVLTALLLTMAPLAVQAQGGQGTPYAAQSGETAASIAARYCMSTQELYSLNPALGSNAGQLPPGTQVIVINRCGGGSSGGAWTGGGGTYCGWGGVYDRGPRLHAQGYIYGNTYVVVRGDTAFSIGQRFGISSSALGQANGINPWYIYAGQRLIIPGQGGYGCVPQPQPCWQYGGYGCPQPYPYPTVIPITPAPTPVVQPVIQVTAPAPNASLPATFTVSGTGQGIVGGSLFVRAQRSDGTVLAQQTVALQGPNVTTGGPGTFSVQMTVSVAAPTPGFVVAYTAQTTGVSVPVTFSPSGGPRRRGNIHELHRRAVQRDGVRRSAVLWRCRWDEHRQFHGRRGRTPQLAARS